jgi:spore coat polysaccharide biosynthesis protein SpsF (cytidylyltransferase family)
LKLVSESKRPTLLTNSILVVQARLNSSRLPAKMLLPLGGRLVIDHILEACLKSNAAYVIVTIPESDIGSPLARAIRGFKSSNGRSAYLVFGPEDGLIHRFEMAIEKVRELEGSNKRFAWLVRVCGDRPFLCTLALNQLMSQPIGRGYVMNHLDLTGKANGIGAEGIECNFWEKYKSSGLLDDNHLTEKLQSLYLGVRNHHLEPKGSVEIKLTKKDLDTLDDYRAIDSYIFATQCKETQNDGPI